MMRALGVCGAPPVVDTAEDLVLTAVIVALVPDSYPCDPGRCHLGLRCRGQHIKAVGA